MNALYNLSFPYAVGGESGSRLRLFHAILLFMREEMLDFTLEVVPIEFTPSIKSMIQLTEIDGIKGRHPIGIPSFAIDRHNKRGKGGLIDSVFRYGSDTRCCIDTGAEEWKINISKWPEEEIAKSHGPGRRFFMDRSTGVPSLLSQFFDEGSWVDKEITPGKDSYRKEAKEFYMYWEQKHGSPNAKSVYIIQEQLQILQTIQNKFNFDKTELLKLLDQPITTTSEPIKTSKKKSSRVKGAWNSKE